MAGDHAFVAGSAGLLVFDITDPLPSWLVRTLQASFEGAAVSLRGDHAYLACSLAGLDVIGISARENPALIGSLGTRGAWGCVDVAIQGDLVLLGEWTGLRIVPLQCGAPAAAGAEEAPRRGRSSPSTIRSVGSWRGGRRVRQAG